MSDTEVNIPLLRKAVEWAEAEAAKPEGGLWIQEFWASPPGSPDSYIRSLRRKAGLTDECGTAYCIAGYVCESQGVDAKHEWGHHAAKALGIKYDPCDDSADGNRLFNASNTIADVRRIAEELAGERL